MINCKTKYSWRLSLKTGEKISYILDDVGRKFIEISDEFLSSEFGIFVTNSSSEVKNLDMLKQVAQLALQSKEITLKDYVSMVKSQSISEIENMMELAEQKAQERR